MRINYATAEDESEVASRLGLPWNRTMQDWPIEVSDENRIDEFITALSSASEKGERICLLELVLASIDEGLALQELTQHTQMADLIRRVQPVVGVALLEFPDVADYWKEYWNLHDGPDGQSLIRMLFNDLDTHSG